MAQSWLAIVTLIGSGLVHLAAQQQGFNTSQGTVENVRFAQVAGGAITVTYDLLSTDPTATFEIVLEVSQDGGKTFGLKPASLSGDIGPNVSPGNGKRIVWDAGRDVETLVVDQFRFNVRAISGSGARATLGGLSVATSPAGAQVTIDGVVRGRTPLELTDLSIGSHRLTVSLPGYLENSRTVDIAAGPGARVEVALTANPVPVATTTVLAASRQGGGGLTKWLLIGGGGAAAAGAAVALGGGSSPQPTTSAITTAPTTVPPTTSVGPTTVTTTIPTTSSIPPSSTVPTTTVQTTTPTTAPTTTIQTTTSIAPNCTASVSPGALTFATNGGTQAVTLSFGPAGCAQSATWAATNTGAPWISASPQNGTINPGGAVSINLTAPAQSSSSSSRSGEVIFSVAYILPGGGSGPGQSARVAVSQAGATASACRYSAYWADEGDSPGSSRTYVPSECDSGGCAERRAVLTANDAACLGETVSTSNLPSWLTQTAQAPPSGTRQVITFRVTGRNSTEGPRAAEFELWGGRGAAGKRAALRVTQCAGRCP